MNLINDITNKTMNELVKVDPKEFGLEESKANELTIGLKAILEERNVLIDSYIETIELEITEENLPVFKELRLKIRDNRTKGIEPWHKVNKQFFLTGGRFVDAIKNKEVAENERMESKLMEAEKYFENLEKERIEKLNAERYELCLPFVNDVSLILPDLGAMPESLWDNYIIGLKASFEAKKAEDKRIEDERLEAERLALLHNERKESILPYWSFIPNEHKTDDFSKLTESEWKDRFEWTVNEKNEYDKKQEAIRLENERLQKEAKAKELRDKKRNEELRPYIVFIRDYTTLLNSEEKEYQKQFSDIKKGAELQWEEDRKEMKRKALQEQKDKEEKEKLQNKLRIKEEKERAQKEKDDALKQSELNKGDADKVEDLINDLVVLKTKYSFKSAKNVKMYNQVGELLDKVRFHIEK